MKKTFLLMVIAMLAISFSSMAQYVDRSSFKAGLNAGLPVGDAGDASSFSLGLDLAYHIGASELLDVGFATGFIHAFGDTTSLSGGVVTLEYEDFQFLPVAGSLRIYPTYDFKLGADVGYAVGFNELNEGGFYLRPIIGYNITGNTELNVSYVNISNDWNFSMATLGILFLF